MSAIMEKLEAHKIVDRLPERATWDDLMHEIYVREVIEKGLDDSKAGRTKEVKEVRARFSRVCEAYGGLPDPTHSTDCQVPSIGPKSTGI